jgi:hypothetical protein
VRDVDRITLTKAIAAVSLLGPELPLNRAGWTSRVECEREMLFCFRNRPGYAGSILASLLLTAVGFSLFSIREHSHEYPLPLPARARG